MREATWLAFLLQFVGMTAFWFTTLQAMALVQLSLWESALLGTLIYLVVIFAPNFFGKLEALDNDPKR